MDVIFIKVKVKLLKVDGITKSRRNREAREEALRKCPDLDSQGQKELEETWSEALKEDFERKFL